MADETPPASPTGQMVGLSKLFNDLPAGAQNAIVGVVGLAVLVTMMPEGLPVIVVSIATKVAGAGVLLGIISGGVRK